MAAYKEQYYNLEENEMQELIAQAKSGSHAAKQELLKVFNNFLSKYVALIYHGRYNLADYDIRRFIGLFVKNPFTRMALMKNKLVKKDHKDVSEIMGRHSLYGKKIWRRRRHTSNNRHNFFPMYS
jgi:hypothetical protein